MKDNEFFPQGSHESSSDNQYEIALRELYGSRIYSGQSILETLCEFLNVVKSGKSFKLFDKSEPPENVEYFPIIDYESISNFSYKASDKLNLKLFSLFLSSSGSSIHGSHEQHYNEIKEKLNNKISIIDSSKDLDNEKVIDILENLFMGFQGVGVNRDWCAQSFLPINQEFLAGETIWKATSAKKENFKDTDITLAHKYFERSSHIIYARGGEVLYLEMFLAFQKSADDINELVNNEYKDIYFSEREKDPIYLQNSITEGLEKLLKNENWSVLGDLAKFIDNIDDSLTFDKNKVNNIGWIPKENWKYGYLFAVELNRVFQNNFEIIELLDVIQILIILHTLRRFNFITSEKLNIQKPLIAIVDSNCNYNEVKDISNSSYMNCLLNIKKLVSLTVQDDTKISTIDKSYGGGVFKKIAKSIGLVVPKTGNSEKFVLTNDMLNCLIATSLLPDEKITLDTFLNQLRLRYGMVFDNKGFNEINNRRGKQQIITRGDT
jgi:predicted house-cleaning noncanonical NTP pyrophosphatase (MazG superfamily)